MVIGVWDDFKKSKKKPNRTGGCGNPPPIVMGFEHF